MDRQETNTFYVFIIVTNVCAALAVVVFEGPRTEAFSFLRDFGALIGAFIGVIGAYLVALLTMHQKEKQNAKSVATGLARKLHEEIFYMQTKLDKFNEQFTELNLNKIFIEENYENLNNFIEKKEFNYISKLYIEINYKLISKTESDRFYFFAEKSFSLEYKIFSQTEMIINYLKNMNKSNDIFQKGLNKGYIDETNEITIKETCVNNIIVFLRTIKLCRDTYKQIIEEYNLKEIGPAIPHPIH